jgi:ParB/RepB/Spo0J family partition protein
METQMLLVADIDVGPTRHRSTDAVAVERLASSMKTIGLRTPITVRYFPDRPSQDGVSEDSYLLVTGAHRLAAAKHLGWENIEAWVVSGQSDSDAQLWEIDENLMRAELGAAEHAKLTGRRAEIIAAKAREKEEKTASLAQVEPGKKKKGRKDVKGVRDAASIRDQAEKTGEDKEKIRRSKKRAEKLGNETLSRVHGTSLDNGAQLDALMKLGDDKREELIKQAEAGEDVSAVRVLAAETSPATEPEIDYTIQSTKMLEDEIAEPDEDEATDPQNYRVAFLLRTSLAIEALQGCKWLHGRNVDTAPEAISKELARAASAVATAWSAWAQALEKSIISTGLAVRFDGLDGDPDTTHQRTA